jgi:integrase/recombinase XerD
MDGVLRSLIRLSLGLLKEQGLTPDSLRRYNSGFMKVFRSHQEVGLAQYSHDVAAELVARSQALVEQGEFARRAWGSLRRCVVVLDEVASTGRLGPRPRRQRTWGLRQPCDEFNEVLGRFCVAGAAGHGWVKGTLAGKRSAVRQFLFAIEDAGVAAVSGLTRRIVSDTVTITAQRYAGGLATWLSAIRAFLQHLHTTGATAADLSTSVPRLSAPHRVIREGFTADEARTLIEGVDQDTTIGKRDRAIMTLAAQNGVRACDLAGLQRSDIDWRRREIRFTQSKTRRAMCLPLGVQSGNAIADYLLNCRVAGDSPYLFASCDSEPIRPMSAKGISAVVAGHMRRCGIHGRVPRRGAHSFRRGLGTGMLDAEVPIDTVKEVLGQRRIDSARPYLSVSEKGLKACAISLADAVGEGAPS